MIKVGQSAVERLLYVVLLLTFVVTGIFYFQARAITQQLRANQEIEKTDIMTVEKENYCLVSFFLQPNRTNITLANLSNCQPIIKSR